MKKLIILFILMLCVFCGAVDTADATTNKGLVKEYCKTHYSECKIVYFTKWDESKMLNRVGKNIVYVEILISTSSGKRDPLNKRYWGYIKGSNYYKTWYNTKVKKGKTVKQYLIYNPYTNYEDDIVAVIDNKKIR